MSPPVDHSATADDTTITLPIIDIRDVLSSVEGADDDDDYDTRCEAAGRRMLAALQTAGAFQCRACGPADADIFATAAEVFAAAAASDDGAGGLPAMGTRAEGGGGGARFLRGYVARGGESGSAAAAEAKDGFSWGAAHNAYPRALGADARARLEALHASCARAAHGVAVCVARALAVDAAPAAAAGVRLAADAPAQCAAVSLSRLFRYHCARERGDENADARGLEVVGSSPHTDWGLLTLIRSTRPGLQMASTASLCEETVWRTVVPEPDCFIVNGGDYLSVITNGRVRSPLHRVLQPQDQDRVSMVFFYYPPFDTVVPEQFHFLETPDADPEAWARLSVLSLFKDQRAASEISGGDSRSNGLLDLKKVSFGEYITRKWESVARY
ncbi:hypothetical protein HDU84_002974 [Entophlyctis sp. JEL0112]|nr:hypothetical protein HDU84_002974 [Entophlyctis sp. JEL0112]